MITPTSRAEALRSLAMDAAQRGLWDEARISLDAITDHAIADATRYGLVQAAIDQGLLDDALLLAETITEASIKVDALTAICTAYAQQRDWGHADHILQLLDPTVGAHERALMAITIAAATNGNGAKVYAFLPMIGHVAGLAQVIVAAHQHGHDALRNEVMQFGLMHAQTLTDDQEQASLLQNTLFLLAHAGCYALIPPFLAAIRDSHARAWIGSNLAVRSMRFAPQAALEKRVLSRDCTAMEPLEDAILAAWLAAQTPSGLWASLTVVQPILPRYPHLGAAILATGQWVEAMIAQLSLS